jgi:hypothetical protein
MRDGSTDEAEPTVPVGGDSVFVVTYRGKSLQLVVGQMGVRLNDMNDTTKAIEHTRVRLLYQSLHGWNWQPDRCVLRLNTKTPPKKSGKPAGSRWVEIGMEKLDGQTALQMMNDSAGRLASEATAKRREARRAEKERIEQDLASPRRSRSDSSDSVFEIVYKASTNRSVGYYARLKLTPLCVEVHEKKANEPRLLASWDYGALSRWEWLEATGKVQLTFKADANVESEQIVLSPRAAGQGSVDDMVRRGSFSAASQTAMLAAAAAAATTAAGSKQTSPRSRRSSFSLLSRRPPLARVGRSGPAPMVVELELAGGRDGGPELAHRIGVLTTAARRQVRAAAAVDEAAAARLQVEVATLAAAEAAGDEDRIKAAQDALASEHAKVVKEVKEKATECRLEKRRQQEEAAAARLALESKARAEAEEAARIAAAEQEQAVAARLALEAKDEKQTDSAWHSKASGIARFLRSCVAVHDGPIEQSRLVALERRLDQLAKSVRQAQLIFATNDYKYEL